MKGGESFMEVFTESLLRNGKWQQAKTEPNLVLSSLYYDMHSPSAELL